MGRIVAIGGGGSRETGPTTAPIDREIVALSGKPSPNLLFFPTASGDDPYYADVIRAHFGALGCRVESLFLIRDRPSDSEIADKIRGADIVYVGGGNTYRMLRWWKRRGVDELLREAHAGNVVLSGLSAGCICWFRFGNSDSRQKTPEDTTLINVRGLDLIHALACPHYNNEPERNDGLKSMMRRTPGVGIAIEDDAAIEMVDDQWRVLASRAGKQAYQVYWQGGLYHEVPLSPGAGWEPMSTLITRRKG